MGGLTKTGEWTKPNWKPEQGQLQEVQGATTERLVLGKLVDAKTICRFSIDQATADGSPDSLGAIGHSRLPGCNWP